VHIEEISLCESYAERPQALVCRTCTRTSDKTWALTKEELIQIKSEKDFKESEINCFPTKVWGDVKVLNTTDHNNRLVPVNQESAQKTRAFVETCGHDIRRECLSCDRFLPIEIDVSYASDPEAKVYFRPIKVNGRTVFEPFTDNGSRLNSWKVAIGGSCTLPVEGVRVNGQISYCDFVPRGKRVESPSCANCFYAYYSGDSWQFEYLEVNENASLTPWEKEKAIEEAFRNEMPIGQSIGLSLWRKQTQGHGRVLSFPVQILRKDYHQGTLKYKVRFEHNNVTAILDAYNKQIFINDDAEIGYNYSDPECSGTVKGVAEIMYPYHKQFNLPDNLKVRKSIWPQLPDKIEILNEQWDSLVEEKCPRCNQSKNIPCYYHAKAPRYNFVKGIVEFTTGRQTKANYVFPPHGILHIEERNGRFVAVDGNGNLPVTYSDEVANASVFRLYLPELLRIGKARYGSKAVKDLQSQYYKIVAMLHFTNPVKVRPNWLKPSSVEPSKHHCSHPNGLDLRKVFMDSFGLERTDIDFDLGAHNTAIVEEELRVGKRQHAQTVQRLHEEMLATITSHPRYREEIGGIVSSDVVWPEKMSTTKLEAIGGMHDNEGNPITNVRDFLDRLDEEVEIGYSGDTPRMISVRQQLFGYDLSRGYYGSRKGREQTVMPAFENEFAIFKDHGEPDQVDITDAWRCVNCNRQYDQSEIENWFSPTCECGQALYRNHNSRVSYNARATGGIGNALAMDNDSMRQRQMLYATLCPKWRLNTQNAVITLDDLGKKSHIQETPVVIASSGPTVHKIGGFLSEEHKKANLEYEQKRELVYAQREKFKQEHPDVTIQELEREFPLPHGIIYVEKAAGSLAKMGGV
jgi:hypothetical protein